MTTKTLLMFLCVAIATSIAQGQILRVNGTLYCTSNGSPSSNANAAPVFPGARLEVGCSSEAYLYPGLSNATTDSTGVYAVFMLPRPGVTINSIVSNCRLFVQTPLSNCGPTLPSAGLVFDMQFVKTVQVGFMYTTYLRASAFSLQPYN